MSEKPEAKLLRRYECEVLDVYHESLPLWNRPKDIAVSALLIAYDSMQMLTGMSTAGRRPFLSTWQFVKCLDDALSQSLRWICRGDPATDLTPPSDSVAVTEAVKFIEHAVDYINLADMHMMYGRGLVDITVDSRKHIIRFEIPETLDRNKVWHGFAETVLNQLSCVQPEEIDRVMSKSAPLIGRIEGHIDNGHIVLGEIPETIAEELLELFSVYQPREAVPLPGESDLEGFSMREYRKFWRALNLWGMCLCLKEAAYILQGYPPGSCVPTQIVDHGLFTGKLARLTKLDPDTISKILSRMTYGNGVTRLDALIQPLICGSQKVAWSPHLAMKYRYERNLLKLMSRISSLTDIAATLIGSREIPLLQGIKEVLAPRGYVCKLNRILSYDDRRAEVDMLAYNHRRAPRELLLIESKAVLGADEVNEIADVTRQMIRGQRQLCRASIILNKMPSEKKSESYSFVDWDLVRDYFLIVVTPESHPTQLYIQSKIPSMTLESLRLHIRRHEIDRPSRLWEACKNKNWLAAKEDKAKKRVFTDIIVGDITYQVPATVF